MKKMGPEMKKMEKEMGMMPSNEKMKPLNPDGMMDHDEMTKQAEREAMKRMKGK